jgi:hypothetical protein
MTIDFEGEDYPCPSTKRLFGSLDTSDGDVPHAVYIAEFPSAPHLGGAALIDILLGKWGEGTQPSDRSIYRVYFFREPERFLVVDAAPRPESAGTALTREQAFASGKIDLIFAILGAMWEQDPRIPWANAGEGKALN